MISVKVSAEDIVRRFEETLRLSRNFAPLFRLITGAENDSRPWTIRGGIIKSFMDKSSPFGSKWSPLTKKYADRKAIDFPGKTMLRRTDRLFNALLRDGNSDGVNILEPRRFKYGINDDTLPYGKWLQFGTKKMVARPFLGISKDQKKAWKILYSEYLVSSLGGKSRGNT